MKTIEDKNYLTVKEFAAAADVSNKAIYQQLKTRLKDYSKSIDSVTMIDEAAIKIFYQDSQVKSSQGIQVDLNLEQNLNDKNFFSQENPKVEDSQGIQVKSSQVDLNDKYISFLEQELKDCKEQLREKDKIIRELEQQIISLSSESLKQSSESLQQIASITKNIQYIQAAEAHEDIKKNQESDIVEVEQPKKTWLDRLRGR